MFTPDDRERIRTAVIEAARADERISGGAIRGSASVHNEHRWSDIDLAFGVRGDLSAVLEDFTRADVPRPRLRPSRRRHRGIVDLSGVLAA